MTGRPPGNDASGSAASGNAASAPRATIAQAAMELRLTARRGENVLVTIVIPLVVLVFFASFPIGDAGAAVTSGRPVDFVLPGVLALAVISTSFVNLGIATAYERSYGVLKRLGGTPLPRAGLVAAKIVAVAAVEVLQVVLLIGVAVVVLGWRPTATASLPLAVFALVAGTICFAGLGLWMAGTLRAETSLAAANGLFVGFLLVGGIVVPVDRLPGVLADLARILPATALADALRSGLGAGSADVGSALLVLAAWAVVAIVGAVLRFRWD